MAVAIQGAATRDVVRILAGARDARRLRLDRRRRSEFGSTPALKALVRLLPRVYDEADDVEMIVEAPPAPRREAHPGPRSNRSTEGTDSGSAPRMRKLDRRTRCATETPTAQPRPSGPQGTHAHPPGSSQTAKSKFNGPNGPQVCMLVCKSAG